MIVPLFDELNGVSLSSYWPKVCPTVCDRGTKKLMGDGRHLGNVTETINTILHHHLTSLELSPSKSVTTVAGLYQHLYLQVLTFVFAGPMETDQLPYSPKRGHSRLVPVVI